MTDPKIPQDDGGPAFPRPIGYNGESDRAFRVINSEQNGMSLRDYFAAQALSAVLTQNSVPSEAATRAYQLADALMWERAK